MKPLSHHCVLINRVSPVLLRSRGAGGFIGSARGCVVRGDAHRCIRGRGLVPTKEAKCRTLPRMKRSEPPPDARPEELRPKHHS